MREPCPSDNSAPSATNSFSIRAHDRSARAGSSKIPTRVFRCRLAKAIVPYYDTIYGMARILRQRDIQLTTTGSLVSFGPMEVAGCHGLPDRAHTHVYRNAHVRFGNIHRR